MDDYIDPRFSEISFLREKAQKRLPKFAFEYLDGGCNSEVNLRRNTADIREVLLKPEYLRNFKSSSLKTTLFDQEYDAPFGIAPIGLQGLIWPGATEILAQAAFDHNIPFTLSTVGTASIEKISEITQGRAWFQLYNPVDPAIRMDLIKRAADSGCSVLVVLADVPVFGYRSREIRNGLSIPPRFSFQNIFQILKHPSWLLETLSKGKPEFKSLKPYIAKNSSLKHLGQFMNNTFNGRLNEDRLKEIRDVWPGKLVLKGVVSVEDAEKCYKLGIDGIIVSNHGGRQLDHGESSISSLQSIVKTYKNKLTIMMDSGIRTGPDVASALAAGAGFTFLGRSFMYGVAALGTRGGNHTIALLKKQLLQVMEQLSCESVTDLSNRLVKP